MQPNLQSAGSVQIIQTADKTFYTRLFYSKTLEPVDLTNMTEIVALFPGSDGTPIKKTFSNSGGITVVGAPGAGKIQIALTSGDTASMQPNPQIGQDLEIVVTIAVATAQVNTLSFGSPPVAQTEYTVTIDDVQANYTAQVSDTAQSVFTALQTQLEQNEDLEVTIAVSGSGNAATMVITSTIAGLQFDVEVSEGITNTDTTPSAGIRMMFQLSQVLNIQPTLYGAI
jgi:hypothetical protein